MNFPKVTLDTYGIQLATNRAKEAGEGYARKALEFLTDPQMKDREKAVECKACFYLYSSRLGGAALSARPCALCELELHSGSTHLPRLCKPCGQKNELCVECGGDIFIRVRRKFEAKK